MRRCCAGFALFLLVALLGLARPAGAQAVYTDSLQNGWLNYGWASLDYNNPAPTHGGSASISVTADAYQALYLHHAALDGSLYANLTFWIHGGAGGGQRLRLQATRSGQAQTSVTLAPLDANVWRQVSIPVSALGVASASDFDGFWIQNTTGGPLPTFYVDDITLGAAPPPASVNLHVDGSAAVRILDNRIYGVNTAIYDGLLGAPASQTLLSGIACPALRFPGGSMSDFYDWSRSQSDGYNFQWGTSFATFARLAESIGAQAYITVNYGSGTPEMAAAWVAYSNGAADSATVIGVDSKGRDWKTVGFWARLRGASPLATDDGLNFLRVNHPASYGFKYWELGNECFGGWENDQHGAAGSGLDGVAHDAYTYAQNAAVFTRKMKAADPTIKIGVAADPGQDSYGNGTHGVPNPSENGAVHSGWTPVVLANLKALGVLPDFVIPHRYPQLAGISDGSDSSLLLNGSVGWKNDALVMRKMLTDYVGGPASAAMEIAATETNSGYQGGSKQGVSLVDGLFHADTLGQLAQTEIAACLWWDFRNGENGWISDDPSLYGWRIFADDGMVSSGQRADTPVNTPYPSYYAAKLLTHWGRGGDQVVAATSDYKMLSVYAAKRTDGTLALLVINKDPTNDLSGHIALDNFLPGGGNASVWRYGKPEDLANADLSQSALSVPGATFDAVFPSYSMTVLTVPGLVAPPAPTGLAGTAVSNAQINLTWNAVSGATGGYTVWRKDSADGSYAQVGTSAAAAFSNTGLRPAHAYTYVVRAVNAAGSSADSAPVTVTTKWTAMPTTRTLAPVADAYVRSDVWAKTNFGRSAILEVQKYANSKYSYHRVAYLKFDLRGVTAPPTQATLALTVTGASVPAGRSGTVKIYGVANPDWSETALTWSQALTSASLNPNVSSRATLAASGTVRIAPGVYTWDLTGYLKNKAGQIVTLQVINDTMDGLYFAFSSREAGRGQPTLTVTY